MAQPLNVGMPDNIDVAPLYTLRVTALDPATGSVVAGVKVTTVVIEGAGSGDLTSGDFSVASPLLLGLSF